LLIKQTQKHSTNYGDLYKTNSQSYHSIINTPIMSNLSNRYIDNTKKQQRDDSPNNTHKQK